MRPRPTSGPTTPSFTNTWESERRGPPDRADPHPDHQRPRQRHDPGAGGLGADADLWNHGRGELRPRRAGDARGLRRRHHHRHDGGLLARAGGGHPRHRRVRSALTDEHASAAPRPRPPHDDSRHVRHLPCAPEVRALAVGPLGAEAPGTHLGAILALLPEVPLVPDRHRSALRGHHWGALPLPQVREVRHLDTRRHSGSRHGPGHGHSGPVAPHRRFRDRRGDGGRQRRALRTSGRRHPDHRRRLHLARVHRGRRGRHGQSRRFDPRVHLHQPARSLRLADREPGPGRHRLLRRAHPHPALQADRPLRPHAEIAMRRSVTTYWIGFAIILAFLTAAPLVLPEFWRRFVTEILIWGLLAMSSDILIGYTGMVSFGHSAFFGLGLYGAAAALLAVKPANLWLAVVCGLAAAAAVAVFVAFFATRLRDIYFAITTLVFSQIFYVIIFTWTEVTGGENGLNFRQPPFSIPGIVSIAFTPVTLHWFVLGVVTLSYLTLRRVTQSPFGKVLQSIRENESRTRAIGYHIECYKIVTG